MLQTLSLVSETRHQRPPVGIGFMDGHKEDIITATYEMMYSRGHSCLPMWPEFVILCLRVLLHLVLD